MISFRKVQIKTPLGKILLQETSFEVPSPTLIGVFGPNGSGKSTLLNAMAGQGKNREIKGEVWVDQSTILHGRISAQEKAKKILYLGSDFQTSFQISVRELLEMAKQANPESKEQVSEVAERFGVTSLLARSFDEMSDGEKQRVMIARGVIQATQWLVLDETFSKIDLDHSFHLAAQLRELTKKGRGVVVASHDLNLLSEMVDELWLLKEAQLLVAGPVEEVLTSENLQKLYPGRTVHVVRSPDNGKKKVIY